MELKIFFGIFLYVVLLSGAVVFVHQTVEEFMKHSTTYSEKQELITLNDLPTISFCLDFGVNHTLIYGEDFSIEATIADILN